jgi:hypothetical protein
VWHAPVIFAVIAALLLVLTVTTPGGGVIDAARRMTAFRADRAGITLGAAPGKLAGHGGAHPVGRCRADRGVPVCPPGARSGRRASKNAAALSLLRDRSRVLAAWSDQAAQRGSAGSSGVDSSGKDFPAR